MLSQNKALKEGKEPILGKDRLNNPVTGWDGECGVRPGKWISS